LPPKLALTHAGGTHHLLLTSTAKLLKRHLGLLISDEDGSTVMGEVTQNPANNVWGLRNLTGGPWKAIYPSGTTQDVPPQKAVVLANGLTLRMGDTLAKITS
jgi:hypothetical protein